MASLTRRRAHAFLSPRSNAAFLRRNSLRAPGIRYIPHVETILQEVQQQPIPNPAAPSKIVALNSRVFETLNSLISSSSSQKR
jgi:hypothetical protein